MAAHSTITQLHFAPRGTGRKTLRHVLAALAEMYSAHRSRRLLTEMDDRMLADIGIGRGDAIMEASRAPWDVGSRR